MKDHDKETLTYMHLIAVNYIPYWKLSITQKSKHNEEINKREREIKM